jgi:hypothetical protein
MYSNKLAFHLCQLILLLTWLCVRLLQVTWSNLETLLVLGAKLDMPAILAHAASFIENHMCLLDMAEGGSRFIWK